MRISPSFLNPAAHPRQERTEGGSDAPFVDATRASGPMRARLRRVDGQVEHGEQPGRVVLEQQLALVQVGDRSASARPSPAPSSERLESSRPNRRSASSAAPRECPARDRRPRSGSAARRAAPEPDFAAARAVADRIFDEVADRLREQLAMAEQRHGRGRALELERGAAPPRRPGRTFRQARRRARRRRTS